MDEVSGQRYPVKFDIIYVDAVVNTNAGTMIYSGYLIGYVFFGETLDRIYISESVKREFKINQQNDKGNIMINQAGEPKDISGDTMVIPYANIINMNLHFINLPEEFNDIEEGAEIEISQSQETGKA